MGNRRKSHRHLDKYALPAGCEPLIRRREKTDPTGEKQGWTQFLLRTDALGSQYTRLGNYISRCDSSSREMNSFKEATLFSSGDQGRNILTIVFPLSCGRQSYIVLWSRRNRSELSRPYKVSRMKRSVALCFVSSCSKGCKKTSTLRPK